MSVLFDRTVVESASFKELLLKIEQSLGKPIFVVDRKNQLLGVVTDGDVRRSLIGQTSAAVDVRISDVMNANPAWVPADCSRYQILSKFSSRIKSIAVVDKNLRIIDIYDYDDPRWRSHKHRSLASKNDVFIGTAPGRVSFFGGGGDSNEIIADADIPVSVLNMAISLKADVTYSPAGSFEVIDLDEYTPTNRDRVKDFFASIFLALDIGAQGRLKFASDIPYRSGLGGSSALLAASIKAISLGLNLGLDRRDIAQIAYDAERVLFENPGGWQDQWASSFGGMLLLQFSNKEVTVTRPELPLVIKQRLANEMFLMRLKTTRSDYGVSSQIQSDASIQSPPAGFTGAIGGLDRLCVGDYENFIAAINSNFADKLSRLVGPVVDEIKVIENMLAPYRDDPGFGYRLCGAGGGGHLLLFIPPTARDVKMLLRSKGYCLDKVVIDEHGVSGYRL